MNSSRLAKAIDRMGAVMAGLDDEEKAALAGYILSDVDISRDTVAALASALREGDREELYLQLEATVQGDE